MHELAFHELFGTGNKIEYTFFVDMYLISIEWINVRVAGH